VNGISALKSNPLEPAVVSFEPGNPIGEDFDIPRGQLLRRRRFHVGIASCAKDYVG
jgi:hypothetical protein